MNTKDFFSITRCKRERIVFLYLLFVTTAEAQLKSAQQIISPYRTVFVKPSTQVPTTVAVNAPLLGNGSSAVAIAGAPEQQTYYLARNDFWRLKSGYNESFPAVLGKLQINIPALKQASYRIEQELYNAVTIVDFRKGDTSVIIRSMVAATNDWLIIEVQNNGQSAITGNAALLLPGNDQFNIKPPLENKFPDTTAKGQTINGIQWIQRGFVTDVDISTMAVVACKIVNHSSEKFSIAPGETIRIVCSMSGNFKTTNSLSFVLQQVQQATTAEIEKVKQQHLSWWHHYWNESYMDIADSVIEHQYYKSQYNMASCSRDPRFPPGIFGSWVTKEIPAWNGDYHLNYNYSAPFYALYSSNHLQQALPYEASLLEFMKRGAYYANKITQIPGAALYPVGIGPMGMETTRKNDLMIRHRSGYIKSGEVEDEGLFFGQKSNAAYCAVNFSMQFYRTYDVAFAKRVYPYMKAVAVFWQHYLKKEGDRYVIENDAIHEGTIGTKNAILSLGLVRMVLQTTIDMSVLLAVDKDQRNDWKEKKEKLSTCPVQVRNGKEVFRYSEKGTEWWGDNTLGIQHIYPAGQIGLNSDRRLLQLAHNTIDEMKRWKDFNGSNSFFPAAVRVGYNADTILTKLHEYSLHTYPNGFQLNNPHGIENCSTVPNTINEMLCMSSQDVIRVFEVWPKEQDASFSSIRCEGAFLVSASLQNRQVQFVKIISEKGRTCNFQNPWPGKMVLVKSNKRTAEKRRGDKIHLKTIQGEEMLLTVSN
jgi:alpha-L-fucosidase 2